MQNYSSRLVDLSREVYSSEGKVVLDRMYKLRQSVKIFLENGDDLNTAIFQTLSIHEFLDIRDVQKITALNNKMFQVLRHLHNTVASASSLIDHTRKFHVSFYEKERLIPGYQERINSMFAKHGLSQFVKCFRQYCQHYKMPLVGAVIFFHDNGSSYSQAMTLTKSDLVEFPSWTTAAKEFIESQPDKINLQIVMQSYREHILVFYRWFYSELRNVHASEIAVHNRLMEEVERIKAEDPLYKDYKPNSTT